jgi:hypothetical protein
MAVTRDEQDNKRIEDLLVSSYLSIRDTVSESMCHLHIRK